jgi:cytochrome c556
VNAAAKDTDNAAGVLDMSAHALSDETTSVDQLLKKFMTEAKSFGQIVRGEKDMDQGHKRPGAPEGEKAEHADFDADAPDLPEAMAGDSENTGVSEEDDVSAEGAEKAA